MIREELKSLLLSFNEKDYCKNVDLHIHSCESDGKLTPNEIVDLAKKQGKKYIAIADHNTLDAYLSTNVLSEAFVIPAVEFDCFYKGNIIHILGYGINIDNQELRDFCTKSDLGKRHLFYRIFKLKKPQEVIEKIHNAGGLAVLAHPACYYNINFDKFISELVNYGIDGLEVHYLYRYLRALLKFHTIKTVSEIADKYNLIKTGGTDSHGKKLL